jgi:hypothetical protein
MAAMQMFSSSFDSSSVICHYGTFLQQLECGYGFPALIHAWIASAGVLEWFISTSGSHISGLQKFGRGGPASELW